MPARLIEAGFDSAYHFWEPWCVAYAGEEIAAIAFAARLGASGAEVGVYTFQGFRGRGLAAAVTAGWAKAPALVGRELHYAHSVNNVSSRRVTERLGLRRIGANFRIT